MFLDEIGEMPIEMQVKILRVLQEKKIRRLGSSKEKAVNVRIVAATNKDLKAMVDEGLFREDLFYRLNVIKVFVPPLRSHKEDIRELVDHFLGRINQQYGFKKRIPEEMINAFMAYNWPGNVRQLENSIERLVVLSRGLNLDPELISDDIIIPTEQVISKNRLLKEIIEETEKEVILKAYQELGSTRKVASKLGVSQPTIVRKLQKYQSKVFK